MNLFKSNIKQRKLFSVLFEQAPWVCCQFTDPKHRRIMKCKRKPKLKPFKHILFSTWLIEWLIDWLKLRIVHGNVFFASSRYRARDWRSFDSTRGTTPPERFRIKQTTQIGGKTHMHDTPRQHGNMVRYIRAFGDDLNIFFFSLLYSKCCIFSARSFIVSAAYWHGSVCFGFTGGLR